MSNIQLKNSNEFPKKYPDSLKSYSWNINGKFGIMPRYTKYCKNAKRESNFFIENYLENYFYNEIDRFGIDLINYINYLVKCFGVSWNEDDECFKISVKRDKENHKKTIFDKNKFYELSRHISLDSHEKANNYLKKILNNMLNFFNSQVK